MKYEIVLLADNGESVDVALDDLDDDFDLSKPICQRQLAEAIDAARKELQIVLPERIPGPEYPLDHPRMEQ